MNYDFLQSYNIPMARGNSSNSQYANSQNRTDGDYGAFSTQSTPSVNTDYYGYGNTNSYNNCYQTGTLHSTEYYQNAERFIPPSKHGAGYMPLKIPFKRKSNSFGGSSAVKKEAHIAEVSADGKLVIFMGRDESYPDELNSLIHPFSCDLCSIKMNSRALAKDHYESKAHDKHISTWLFTNYTEKGISPPKIKRFIKQGPTGPDAYYCEACDLKLTSITHANQHYTGKKHRLVIAQRAKPSGAGFYNSEGKWVRTGTKVTPNATKGQRFSIGDPFQLAEISKSNESLKMEQNTETVTSVADTTTTTENEGKSSLVNSPKKPILTTNSEQDPALFCSICKVSVTSAVQMTMHLNGSKHIKKLKSAGLNPIPIDNQPESQTNIIPPSTISDNVLFSAINEEIKPNSTDLSMYRTPSGQYYCKTCNTSMSHLPGLEQHLKGKRHLKRLTEDKAKASLSGKKN